MGVIQNVMLARSREGSLPDVRGEIQWYQKTCSLGIE